MPRMLTNEEMDRYLAAVAASIHTVDRATIGVNLLVRMRYGELSSDEYNQLLARHYGSPGI